MDEPSRADSLAIDEPEELLALLMQLDNLTVSPHHNGKVIFRLDTEELVLTFPAWDYTPSTLEVFAALYEDQKRCFLGYLHTPQPILQDEWDYRLEDQTPEWHAWNEDFNPDEDADDYWAREPQRILKHEGDYNRQSARIKAFRKLLGVTRAHDYLSAASRG